jgi:hypothetical protein
MTSSHHAKHLMPLLPEDLTPVALLGIEKASGVVLETRVCTELGRMEDL